MEQVSLDLTLQCVGDFLIPHVSIHDTDSMLYLELLIVQLLNDAPNLIQTVCKDQATRELNSNHIRYFPSVLWGNVSITDGNHRCWGPVNWVWILSAPFVISDGFLVEFHEHYPTTFMTVFVNSTLPTQVIRNVKESTCDNVTKHKDFCQE